MALYKRFKTATPPPQPDALTPPANPDASAHLAHHVHLDGEGEPALEEDFLAGLVWNEETVAQGLVPDRRENPAFSRRALDVEALETHQQMTAEEYQAQVQQAYEEGYTQGQEAGYQAGYESAREEGYQAGYEEGAEASKSANAAVWDILEQLDKAKSSVLEKSVKDIVPMAMAIASRIIKTEVSCDRSLVVAIARDVLDKVDRGQKEVVFKVHPSDVQRLRQDIETHEEIWQGEVRRILIVVGDEGVEPGSVIAESGGGQIDASFRTQLNTLRKVLGLPEEDNAEAEISGEDEFAHLLENADNASPEAWETPFEDEDNSSYAGA